MNPKVSIIRCESYDQLKVDKSVRQSIEELGIIESIVKKGSKVLLKVNLLSARKPEDAVTTHPAIVSALIDIILELGGEPIVADESGYAYPGTTKKAARVSGIQEVVDKKKVQFVPFDSVGFSEVEIPKGLHLRNIYYSKLVLDTDVLISVPKLKNHTQTIFTGAVKNMFGCVPASVRMAAHRLSRYVEFSEAVVDIYSVMKPHLAVMDAIWGMEGNGPSRGNPRKISLILASNDCVALDAVACSIVGYDPFDLITTRSATMRDLGEGRIENIDIVGESISNVKVKDFKKPTTRLLNLPLWLGNIFYQYAASKPFINPDLCQKCKVCYESCPVNAIIPNDKFYIDQKKCIKCYCCHELCPHDAVMIKESIIGRLMR